MTQIRKLCTLFICSVGVFLPSATAQRDRITSPISNSETVVLKDSVSPLAKPENDLGPLDPTTKLPYVTMLLKSSPEQEAARKQLLEDQQNPSSPNYHKWLTPEEYADRFGISRADIATIKRWLHKQGFKIVEVAHGRNWIAFSGTVGQIETTLHTQIHRVTVDGEERYSNINDPSIPKALEGIVSGFRGLNSFTPKSLMIRKDSSKVTPDYTDGSGNHYLAPDDIATIYDITALYTAGIDGTGMKIAIMGQTDVHMTDIEQFRSGFNLSANDPTPVVATGCADPGFTADEGEADLDLEWSGAVARDASIIYVICDVKNNGVIGSLQYAVNNNVAPVISLSYGSCEANIGQSLETTFYEPILKQAVAQGQTLMVSSGDAGAATCDNQNTETIATQGLAINGFASPPEATAVGGTEFDADVKNPATYWSSTNGATGGSAIQYIPELAWNDGTDGTNLNGGLWGTGGGASVYFMKPVWQTGSGVPNDNARDVPDVAMTASGAHDGYIFCTNVGTGGTYTGSCANGIAQDTARVGGTSASAPVFAGVITLLNHYLNKTNGTPPGQGNINPKLYGLAASTPRAFHDIPAGNYSLTATPSGNMVPCQTSPGTPNCPNSAPFEFGFTTGMGYDQATGLGSVDAYDFVIAWANSLKTQTVTMLTISPQSTVTAGTSVTLTATITPAPPNGETVTFIDAISGSTFGTGTTSSGTAVFASTTIAVGSYNVVANYPGDASLAASSSASSALTVQKNSTTTTLAISPQATVTVGTSLTLTATITPAPPSGETVTFTDATSGTTLGTANTASGKAAFTSTTIAAGSYTVIASYSGDATFAASTSTPAQALNVEDFTLSPSTLNVTVSAPGQNGSATITFGLLGGLTQAPSFSCSGLPSESTCTFTAASATTETVTVGTTAASWLKDGIWGHGNGIFYGFLLPSLVGLVLPAGRRKQVRRSMIGLVALLAVLALWIPACGGSGGGGGTHNPGTPVGQTNVTVAATEAGISHKITMNLNVQ